MYRKMLVANDGSPGGAKALEGALELAKRLEIALAMVCVEDVARFPAVVDVVAEAQAERASAFDTVVELGEDAGAGPGRPVRGADPGRQSRAENRRIRRARRL